ncbi:CBS domain-containing protein [Sulfoacidibacillus thermotolerans]|uniref:CBS domain-containing protein n=1 Tax=Sulfoacidibacillus thermotolerans TaxID=1765684 RepID=A0A2U3D9F7_SULT2|nr:CBS domain-containing protein [Sulfoacidibacillus thermotolerans]PWI57917.1 CBS domain-containing protein [Sulfoacidibacillus thermotolerans]
MLIRDLMTTNVQTCSESTSLTEVAKQMASQNVGSIPVVQNGKLVGIVTDRDIVTKCIAKNLDCNSTTASSCMTRNPVTVSPETDAHEAARLMSKEQIRRLPVVENGKLVGICALGDLAVVDIHVNEAGEALSGISEQTQVH